MPTADQHQRKAEKNRRLLTGLDTDAHPEWAVTVAFYVAVHRIEQLRHALGHGHSSSHADRGEYVETVHRGVLRDYDRLYQASRTARYDSASEFFALYDAEMVRTTIVAGWLAAVDRYVDQRLAPPEVAP